MRTCLFLGCILPFSGCSGSGHVPVSGVVTLNGKPLAGALVSFQLIVETPDPLNATPRATGRTNERGAYSLKSPPGSNGALPGKHKVMIALTEPDKGAGPGEPVKSFTQLPDRYNADSELTCEVPPRGKKDADFKLTLP
jgi:hypothetical protein